MGLVDGLASLEVRASTISGATVQGTNIEGVSLSGGNIYSNNALSGIRINIMKRRCNNGQIMVSI